MGRASPLRSAALYFLGVLCWCFVLGTVRVLLLLPVVGIRDAELMQLPVMLAMSAMQARALVRRAASHTHSAVSPSWAAAVGAVALSLMLCAEVTLAALSRGVSHAQPLLRDNERVTGPAYLASLAAFAAAPWYFAMQRVKRAA
jgi:hypothetical protein